MKQTINRQYLINYPMDFAKICVILMFSLSYKGFLFKKISHLGEKVYIAPFVVLLLESFVFVDLDSTLPYLSIYKTGFLSL